ncbi:DMT family transporter [Pseudoduganella sp. UC29_106]|uniref:DMT family transporter n=1 Tax=Pseudoduganella sp. UC29_106 TaxID=3374553 RepID=UPI00375706EB
MNTANLIRLVTLAAIWGGSFLFMRIAAPVLGPAVLIEYRVTFAALFLAAIALLLRKPLHLRQHWKHYLILGLFNSALPFLLFAFAARTLSASVLSVLNATAPMWGALIGAVWQRQMVSARVMLGLALGTVGVALLVGFDHVSSREGAGIAIAAGVFAAFNYGIASTYAKSAKAVEPFANAHGSMLGGRSPYPAIACAVPAARRAYRRHHGRRARAGHPVQRHRLPALLWPDPRRGANVSLTVTFLNPLFGILWGTLFLHEVVGWYTIVGAAIVISGTMLVTGYKPPLPWLRKTETA